MIARAAFVFSLTTLIASAQDVKWVAAHDLRVEGQGWHDLAAPFDRLPAKAEKTVRKPVWNLSRDSAGLAVRFRTDASEIRVRWTLTKATLAMPHMPATGVSSVDLYVKHGGTWRWLATPRPTKQKNEARLVRLLKKEPRDYLLYLPLYNGVSELAVGVPQGASLTPPRSKKRKKPIVFYGTSITQGGCASRPGMVHTAILGRTLDRPIINLGFSGNGTMDQSMADLLAELEPAIFVIDCLPNMNAKEVAARTEPLVRTLRKARPKTPIVLVEDRTYQNWFLNEDLANRNANSRRALRKAYTSLRGDGVKHLHYIPGDGLLGDDGEGTVDGSHPTDLGFARQAKAFEATLRPLLK